MSDRVLASIVDTHQHKFVQLFISRVLTQGSQEGAQLLAADDPVAVEVEQVEGRLHHFFVLVRKCRNDVELKISENNLWLAMIVLLLFLSPSQGGIRPICGLYNINKLQLNVY